MKDPHETARLWCEKFQTRLMEALDAAWSLAETASDPAVAARALAKAKLCGHLAASARKVAALTPAPTRAASRSADQPALAVAAAPEIDTQTPRADQAVVARTALERLKAGGGRRGRL